MHLSRRHRPAQKGGMHRKTLSDEAGRLGPAERIETAALRVPRFRELLMSCLKRCYNALEIGGRLAVLIGDVRRASRYTPIVKDVLNFPYGEIRSVIIKVQHNCTSDRKSYGRMEDVPIRHEYCVVFKKVVAPSPGPQVLCGGSSIRANRHQSGTQRC
jgi:hypothetical protein